MPVVKKLRGTTPTKTDAEPVASNGKLVLPSRKNSPPKSLSDYCIVIYGEKGIGKSTLASSFPDTLNFMFEPRRRNLSIYQIPDPNNNEPELTWPRFKQYIRMLIEEKSQYKTIVIDTIDRAYDLCFYQVCKDNMISHPADVNDYGKSWGKIRHEFENTITSLLHANIGVIFTSHAKTKEVAARTGGTYEIICPTCSTGAFDYLKACTDLAFYYGYQGQTRTLKVRGDDLIWSACGLEEHFLDPKGNQIHLLDMGETPDESYKRLQEGFNNKLYGIELEEEPEPELTDEEPVEKPKALKKRK